MRNENGKPPVFSEEALKDELMREARAVKIPVGTAEQIAVDVVGAVAEWANRRAVVTEVDVNQRVVKEVQKYNADLAYVYQNRGKII